ncbi:MAG TPA: dipeptide epimerase [Polyangiaceae bacterium]|nr:dipeptide epimerase [Polyangiaceae bacterium]
MTRIRELSFTPLDVPLIEPFGIATGAQVIAHNVLVHVCFDDGTTGLGEAAPFPAVNGETQASVLAVLPDAARALAGRDATRFRPLAEAAREAVGSVKSALCAVETALLDAFCRRAHLSLWEFFGGAEAELETDITIPTGEVEHAHAAALRAQNAGFGTLKVKVGGAAPELDLARLRAIGAAAPRAALILDANASLSADEAVRLLDALGELRERVVLFEQPTAADDLDGLRAVLERGRVSVAADESARSAADVAALARAGAGDVVNVKLMKAGLLEAWDMIATARAANLGLMIGGMVETELAMTTSASLAAGLGGFRFVDLDTPLFMGKRPLVGGFAQTGARLGLRAAGPGHGVGTSAIRGKPATVQG